MEAKTTDDQTDDDRRGMDWWNGASELEREFWLRVAISARPVDAWRAYKFVMLNSPCATTAPLKR